MKKALAAAALLLGGATAASAGVHVGINIGLPPFVLPVPGVAVIAPPPVVYGPVYEPVYYGYGPRPYHPRRYYKKHYRHGYGHHHRHGRGHHWDD